MASIFKGIVPLQFATTRNPDDGRSTAADVLALRYDYTDVLPALNIPASAEKPILLKSVTHAVIDAFTGGSDPRMQIGDGSTAAYFLTAGSSAGQITSGTAGSVLTTTIGKWLEAPLNITVTISGSAAAGQGLVLAEVVRFDSDIVE